MNFFAVSGLLTFLTSLSFGILSWSKGKKQLNRIWAIFCFCVAIWGLGAFKFATTLDVESVLFWLRFGHLGVIMLPALFLHFIYDFLEIVKRTKSLLIVYACSALFLTLNITDWSGLTSLLISHVRFVFNQFYVDSPPGLLYPTFLFYYFGTIIYAHYIAIIRYRSADQLKQMQMKYFLMATIVGFSGGASAFFMVFGIDIYPTLHITVPLYPIIMTYAIVNYKLMDIEVVIKKTLVFAGLFTFVYAVFVTFAYLGQFWFEQLGANRWAAMIPSVLVVILILRPLENYLIRITDKYLFQKKFDYKHLIRQFMDELKSMNLNPQDIAQSTLDFLAMSIRPESSAVFMLNNFTNNYDLLGQSSVKKDISDAGKQSKFFDEVRLIGRIINLKKDIAIQGADKVQLSKSGIELVIPLMIRNDLLGVLLLGVKKSGEGYSDEDIEVLADLSGALAIAINNAQLFEQRADAEKRAMIGTLAAGINHEIGNPLNIIKVRLQSFKLLHDQGLLKDKTKDDLINDFLGIINSCLQGTRRIADITEKIAEFAKPDKKLVFDKVNVEQSLESTIDLLKNQVAVDKVSIIKKINCNTPWIQADKGQFGQIVFNLIRNAVQAMNKENSQIEVIVNASKDEIDILIKDNGMGIPARNLEKLFTPFYTTKEPGKGTGLGLSLVKIMVERNNGKIGVESTEGIGTTFKLTFKGGERL